MRRWHCLLSVLLIGLWLPTATLAADEFLKRKEEGWFWYKDPPDPPKKAEPKVEEPPPVAPPAPPPEPPKELPKFETTPPLFSVAWFRKNFEKIQNAAIDDPTPDNVAAMLYAQRIMLEKSDNFATASTRMSQSDPYLDENNRVPLSTALRSATFYRESKAKGLALTELSKKAGLIFYFDSRCNHCVVMQQAVNAFSDKHNFIVYNVSIDGNPLPNMKNWVKDTGRFRDLGLQLTPTVVLAVPPSTYLVLAQGAMSYDMLEGRALVAAEDQKLLPVEMIRAANVYDRGRISPGDLKQLGIDTDPDDPKTWVAYIRKTLGTAY